MSSEGFVEYLNRNMISGWARSFPRAGDLDVVTIKQFGVPIAKVAAFDFRPDLSDAGIGDGRHGFHYFFPSSLDVAQIAAITVELGGEELSFADGAHRIDGDSPAYLEALYEPPTFVDSSVDDQGEYPVFLLGAPRSGTSSMLLSLLHIGKYKGFGEGHFFSVLPRLSGVIDRFYDEYQIAAGQEGVMINAIERSVLDDAVVGAVKSAARHLMSSKYWVDKTPTLEMIHQAKYFKKIWPNATFIFMKRRAIENIQSKMTKFPDLDFEHNCHEWTNVMSAWTNVRSDLSGSYIEIEQADALHRPRKVAREVGRLLELDATEVLRFAQALSRVRAERTEGVVHGEPVALKNTGWSKQHIQSFQKICGPTMSLFGYEF